MLAVIVTIMTITGRYICSAINLVTITGRYICSANNYGDSNGEVYVQC